EAVDPSLDLSGEGLITVAEICARLDGLPLAIELSAARSKLLSPAAMLRRMERRLPLLGGGARDLPERQRTLGDTIAWSYDLLSASEQALFRLTSAFVGGCDLESIETLAADMDSGDVPDGVASLVAKNLLRRVDSGQRARFEMLETIREFG